DNSGQGIFQRFYQVLEYDGTFWGANRDNGFAFETFDSIYPNWTTTAGNAYILNNTLHQTDTVTTNTNNYLDVAQNNSGAYLYTFDARLWSGATNRRFGIHIFADNPTGTNRGNSYLIWFRGDNQTVQIYETINDALFTRVTQPLNIGNFVWYGYKVVYDPGTGKIDVFQENNLVATWTDSSPLTTGTHISLRTNQAHMDYENVRVWKKRGISANVKIGPASTEDCRYQSPNANTWAGQVHAISRDGADNWSNMDFRTFKIDWTPPSDPSIVDGLAADIDTTYQDSSLSGNWTASTDLNSGILRYEIALGSSPGATDVLGFTDIGTALSHTETGLSLTHNQLYYVTVRAVNLAELPSADISSDGQLVWAPLSSAGPDGLRQSLTVFPNPFGDLLHLESRFHGPLSAQLRNPLGQALAHWQVPEAGRHRLHMPPIPAGIYFLEVRTDSGERAVFRLQHR
ncbi:MAG: T9SS type A sorting domain-containing protein, partial [Bacteroidota bacterium]